jgi:MFS family permease
MGATPLQQVAWFTPMGIGGTFIAIFGGLVLHKMPMKLITFISSLAVIADSLLFALIPDGANYWAFVFPATWFSTIAIDLMFSAVSIFFSTSVPSHQQGLAGAVSNAILQLAITLGLGFADVVVSETMPAQGRQQAYRNAFWLEAALGAVSLIVFMAFVWIAPAKADYTADEKESIRLSIANGSVARSILAAPSIMEPELAHVGRAHER